MASQKINLQKNKIVVNNFSVPNFQMSLRNEQLYFTLIKNFNIKFGKTKSLLKKKPNRKDRIKIVQIFVDVIIKDDNEKFNNWLHLQTS